MALDPMMAKSAALFQRRIEKSRTDLITYIETVCKEDKGNTLVLSDIQKSWISHTFWCWEHGYKPIIMAPMGSGKCGPARHKIQLSNGLIQTIGELKDSGDFEVLAFDENTYSFRPAKSRLIPNGFRKIIKVKLLSGREIETTEEHPYFTVDGWKEAKDLAVGTFTAVSRTLPDMGKLSMKPGEAKFIGMLIADGSLTGEHASFTKSDLDILAECSTAAKNLGFSVNAVANKDSNDMNLNFSGGVRKWARCLNLYNTTSHTKKTPSCIFTAPNSDIADYIRAYFSCDGSITSRTRPATKRHAKGTVNLVELYSINKQLLIDVQNLLLRFGVIAQLRVKKGKYKGEDHYSWRLVVAERENLIKFRDQIGLIGAKGKLLDALILVGGKDQASGNVDIIPNTYRKYLKHQTSWYRKIGCSIYGPSKRGTTRKIVKTIAEYENSQELKNLTSDSIYWDEVVSVEALAIEQETWSIEVDDLHTYVSDGVILHNTSGFSVPLITWMVGNNPNIRIKILTNDDEGAQRRCVAAKKIIESNVYKAVFPQIIKGDKWTDHEIIVKRSGQMVDPTIQSRGINTTGVGSRADLIVIDDIVDQKNSLDPEQRKRILDILNETWLSRLVPDGKVMWIGTAWYLGDATLESAQRPGWATLIQRVTDDCDKITQELVCGGDVSTYPGLIK